MISIENIFLAIKRITNIKRSIKRLRLYIIEFPLFGLKLFFIHLRRFILDRHNQCNKLLQTMLVRVKWGISYGPYYMVHIIW